MYLINFYSILLDPKCQAMLTYHKEEKMKPEINKDERRKFMGGMAAACAGVAATFGISKKARAADNNKAHGQETLYRKTHHHSRQ